LGFNGSLKRRGKLRIGRLGILGDFDPFRDGRPIFSIGALTEGFTYVRAKVWDLSINPGPFSAGLRI
jgi:hypothetical protein